MSELSQTLHIYFNGSTQTCKIYSTTAEAGSPHLSVYVNGVIGYVPLLTNTSDSRASHMRVKYNGTTYAVATSGKPAYTKLTYATPGTYYLTIPSGITAARLSISGGGGGAGGTATMDNKIGYGGSGGKGYTNNSTVAVTPGVTYTIVVGAAGTTGGVSPIQSGGTEEYSYSLVQGYTGGTGGTSSFGGVVANGGAGGMGGGVMYAIYGASGDTNAADGPAGAGGNGANPGAPGWVIVEYGGDI